MKKADKKPWEYGVLRVQENKRYLANGDVPFFWLGDTAWLLFENLDPEESRIYLKNRSAKGFNVIQATLIHNLPQAIQTDGSMKAANKAGYALLDNDFTRPNLEGGFWEHVDNVVGMAEELGLYMALLPSWGSMVKRGLLNMDNAEAYGTFLAKRYGNRKNIIWLIGGDVRGSDGYDVFMKLGKTIKDIAPGQLTGFHPFGRTSSSLWFNDADWLDFNMFQSGHRRYDQSSLGQWDDNAEKEGFFGEDNWRYVKRDYNASVKRPTLDGEPSYEQIPQGLHDPAQPYWQDYEIRRYAWWSVLEGACGHTFGHNAIMQFYNGSEKRSYGVKSPWYDAIHDPGAGQMGHMARFMNALDFSSGHEAQYLLPENGEKHTRISAFSGDGFAVFYTYTGKAFKIKYSELNWTNGQFYWYDPAADVYSFIKEGSHDDTVPLTPPVKPSGHNDWILLIIRA